MNKIYKVIYNKVRNCYVVVSELAKSHGKEQSQRTSSRSRIGALTLAITLCLSSYALAAEPVDLGNGGKAAYDTQGNLIIGKETVAKGEKAQGQNNTTIGTNSDTLRNVAEGETTKNGQPMDNKDNTQLVSSEGKAADLTTSTESGGSTTVGYNNHAEGDNSTAIGNGAKITNKPITYYADADGNKTTDAEKAVWYKDKDGNPTQVPQVFRDADGNTTTTPQYVHTYTEKDPATGEEVTKTEITSDASKSDQKDGKPVYNYQKSDNTDHLYSVTLYQSADNSIAAGTEVTANGSNAVAVGYRSTADNSAVAVGDTAVAKENGVAIGKETKASVEGSIALGKGSEADRSGGITGWDPKTGTTSVKTGTAWQSGEGALSIGNGSASRQITHVAAGSEDSDAVNLAQLKEAMTHYYSVKTTEATDKTGNNNYLNDGATGDNALAAGVSAVAKGNNATAVGTQTYASGEDASAYGYRAAAMGKDSVSIGSGTSAQQEGSVAVGGHAQGYYAVQVGTGSTAQSAYSVAVGGHAKGDHSVEVGYGSTAQGSYSASVGGHAIGNYSIAIGSSKDNWGYINAASAAGDNSIAIGGHTNSANNIAIGSGSATSGQYAITVSGHATSNQAVSIGGVATNSQAIAVGYGSSSTGSQSTAVGGHAGDTNSTAVGQGANANYAYATAVGNSSVASGVYSTALGYGTSVQGSSSTAIGGASAKGSNVTAIGKNSTVGGDWSNSISDSTVIGGAHISASDAAAIGSNATVNGQYGVALGYNSNVSYASTGVGSGTKASNTGTAVGYGAQSSGYQSAAVGAGSNATGQNAVALGGGGAWGNYSIALGSGAGTTAHGIAIGQNSGAWGESAIAIGEGSNAWRANSIVLGKNSKSGADKNIEGYDPHTGVASVDDTSTWQSTDEAVSIGRAEERDGDGKITATAITRQLNNLAAGTLDTDAVNVAQLKAAAQKVNVHDYSVWSPDTETDTNYTNEGAVAKNSMAAGVSASTTKDAENAVAIGYKAKADGFGATVIGQYGTATGRYSLAFGGQQTDTTAEQANNVASGDNAVSFGERTTAGGANSTAFGNEAVANNYGSTAFGNRTEALGEYSTAFGNSTVAAGMNTVAFGTDNVAGAVLDDNGAYTNIIYKTNAKGRVERDANGNPIEISREKMDARGNLAYTDSNGSTKSVTYTVSGGETHSYVLLQGEDGNTYIRDYRGNIRSAAIGSDGTVTVGDAALTDVTLKKATAGANGYHILSNANATVWGENSIASGEASTAFGIGSTASGKNSVAIGGATASLDDSIALGKGSVTTRAKYSELTKGAEKAAYGKGSSTGSAWEATDNAVAVGNDSATTRQITGVAAGSLDTDAVNVAQLKAIDARHTTVSVGGTKAATDGATVNGGNLELTRSTTNGQYNYDVSLNKDITLGTQEENKGGSLTINTLGTFHEKDEQGQQKDVPIKEAVKIDGSTISIVKHDSTDGVNDQRQVVLGVGPDAGGYVVLYDKTGKKPTYIYNSITPGATYLQDGNSYTADKANEYGRLEYGDYYNGTTQFIATQDDGQKYAGDNYKAAETETTTVDGKTTTTIKTDEQNVLLKKLNERLDIKGGATGTLTDNNIGVNVENGVIKVQLAQNLNLTDNGSVKMGNTTIENGGVTITPTDVTDDNKKISLSDKGLSNGGKQITHVDSGLKDADGNQVDLATAGGDVLNNAVNVGDLKKVASAHTAVTVNGEIEAPDAGADGKLGAYTDKEKGNLLLAQKKDTTGKITYDLKLNDNVILGKDGSDGKDGQEGTIGLTGKDGLPGADGKQGYSTTIIKTEKGQAGKDGKNGKPGLDGTDITRIVYTDKNGQNPQTVATLDDGLRFAGDDTSQTVAKKLNETLQIRGDGTYDKEKNTVADDGNIKTSVNNGAVKVSLSDKINLHQDGYLTVGGSRNGNVADGNDPIVIKHFDAGALTVTGTDKEGKTPQSAAGDYVTGLDNKNWNVENPTYVSGRAATEDQLKKVSDAVNKAASTAGKHTVVTVNDKDNETTAPVGTDGSYGAYSDSAKGNLLIAAKDENGKTTYNIKLNDNLTIGQKGADGQDGKDGNVTVETKGGTTVVIGHDGKDGEDGKDGISVKGKDGKDGVTIGVTNGTDGTDGSEGHIGLTGPAGKDGKNASADIHVKNGQNGVDGTDGNNGKDGMDRVVYEDHNGKTHEVATLDDGLKFMGNDNQEVVRKLNTTLSIKGGLDKDAVASASSKNLGVRQNSAKDGLEIVMTDTPDFAKVTVGKDAAKKITIGEQTNGKHTSETGNYITGLDNTQWDKDNIVENRAATEGQLSQAINDIKGTDNGGFGLADEAGNTVKKDLGQTVTVKGDGKNIETKVKDDALEVSLKKDVVLGDDGSVKAGETIINKDGVNTNEVKVGDITITDQGINGGAKQITNIGSGISGNMYADAGDNNAASIGDVKQLAKNEAKASEAKSGKNITVNDDHTVNLNDDIILGNDSNKQVAINGSNGQVVIGSGDSAMTLGKQANTAGDSNPENGNYLNGLDNKKWDGEHIQSGRAATEDQLKTVSDKVNSGRKFQGDDGKDVTVDLGKTLNIKGGATAVSDANNIGIVRGDDNTLNVRLAKDLTGLDSVTTGNTTINNSGLTVKGDDNHKDITIQQGSVNMGGNKITGVAPGAVTPDSTDAVNGSQLYAAGQAISNLGGAVNKLGTRVDRVGAGSAALAALHPLDFDPDDKWDFAAGYGHYRGANAAAVGAYYRPNEDTMFSIGGSFGGGENMFNAGVSIKLGQGNHISTSRVAMAKEMEAMRRHMAEQDALIAKLESMHGMAEGPEKSALFPDVAENHWAYQYVTALAKKGLLEGYPDGEFKGDRMMTRYEFAAIVYRIVESGVGSTDPELSKLVKEFSPELQYIRIDTIHRDDNGQPTVQRVRIKDRK